MTFLNHIFIGWISLEKFIHFPHLGNDGVRLACKLLMKHLNVGFLAFLFCFPVHCLPAWRREYGGSSSFQNFPGCGIRPDLLCASLQTYNHINQTGVKGNFFRQLFQIGISAQAQSPVSDCRRNPASPAPVSPHRESAVQMIRPPFIQFLIQRIFQCDIHNMGNILIPRIFPRVRKILREGKPLQLVDLLDQSHFLLQLPHVDFQDKALSVIGQIHQTKKANIFLPDSRLLFQLPVSRIRGHFPGFNLASRKVVQSSVRILRPLAEQHPVLFPVKHHNTVHMLHVKSSSLFSFLPVSGYSVHRTANRKTSLSECPLFSV